MNFRTKREEEWTTVSSWQYYQQSAVVSSPQLWRRRQDPDTGIYDNVVSVKQRATKKNGRKANARTRVMTPWRSNQLYQGRHIDFLSDTETPDLDWRYADDNVSIDSDQDICTGGLEIDLYPSLTSLDKISESNSSASGGSAGKISRFLNSLFRRKAKKRNEDLKRTSSLPQGLSKTDGPSNERKIPSSPPIPPRSASLALTTPRKACGSSDGKTNGLLPRRNSESNIKECFENSKKKKVKRRAPLPPKLPLAMSRNTERSISIISGKNDDIDHKWKNHLGGKKEQNGVKRKKRAAPQPPVPKTVPKPNSNLKTADQETVKRISQNGNSPQIELYATWPKKPGETSVAKEKVKVSLDQAQIVPHRWAYTSKRSNQDESADEMLKIYIPLIRGDTSKSDEPQEVRSIVTETTKEVKPQPAPTKHLSNGVGDMAPKANVALEQKVKTSEVPKTGWRNVTRGNVKSMAAIFDDMSIKEPEKVPAGPPKEKIPLKKKSKDQEGSSEVKNDQVKTVERKPPSGQVKSARRRKNRRKDVNVTRKRLSPLFETSGQKNDLEEEIASLLKDLPPENQVHAGLIGGVEMASSAGSSVHVNRLFRKLSVAISSGQYERAAILARQLAMLKAQCATTTASAAASLHSNGGSKTSERSTEEKIVSVSMYIEDKDTHHGPIPLNLSPKMSLRLLKKMVEYHFGFPVGNQRWILGKALATEDNLTLSEFGVTQGCAIFLYLINEPPSPAPPRRNESSKIIKEEEKNIQENKKFEKALESRLDGVVKDATQNTQNGARPKEPRVGRIISRKERTVSPSPERVKTEDTNGYWKEDGTVIPETEDSVVQDVLAEESEEESAEEENIDSEEEVIDGGREEDNADIQWVEVDHKIDEAEEEGVVPTIAELPPTIPELPAGLRKIKTKNENKDVGATARTSHSKEDLKDENNGEDLMKLMEQQEKLDLIPNAEEFECVVCLTDIPSHQGVVLRECLHMFCKECLGNAIEFCEDAMVKCLYRDDHYSCQSHLLDREIKKLVTPEVYEKHLQRSVRKAESQDSKSFHCKTANCTGWCLYEDSVNIFNCPVCHKLNCLNCQAIHEGRNCQQYQEETEFHESNNADVRKTKRFLDSMITEGTAMRCPKCQVVVLKKWGCDWLKCCVCDTEICWVTKGPRWGPAGKGDTSGGCRCRVNGLKCHPLCNYCH